MIETIRTILLLPTTVAMDLRMALGSAPITQIPNEIAVPTAFKVLPVTFVLLTMAL